jgi:2-polyprenyl-6-methoxyphenol hydroxylase-like FAD-dependent oxidoreductase
VTNDVRNAGVIVPESPIAVFDRLTSVDLPHRTPVLFDTACVLGGSIAGLLAARVLADHAHTVLIIERDQVNVEGRPRAGVPQDRQGHGLLPGGLAQIERLATTPSRSGGPSPLPRGHRVDRPTT